MIDVQLFEPKSRKSNYPLVLALPGIVHQDERTRMDDILDELSKKGILGIRMNYADITIEKGKGGATTMKCKIDMKGIVDELSRTFNDYVALGADASRIGLISNSLSSMPATSYLIGATNRQSPTIHAYASISPLLGWEHFANEETRDILIKSGRDIPISTAWDMEQGITRVIPKELIPELKRIDFIRDLKEGYRPNGMHIMTIIGRKDTISNPNSMASYHTLLGGKSEEKIELEMGHNVPDSNHYVIGFMERYLLSK